MEKKLFEQERRQAIRIKKHYIIRFSQKDNPSVKFEVSQVDNISKGGMCFSSSLPFDEGTVLDIELRTPYIAETVHLEGVVLDSKDKIKGVLFINRLRFGSLSPAGVEILEKIESYHTKGEKA